MWGIQPKFLFQLKNSGGRAAAPESDERSRITTNVCVCADGSSLPPSFIIINARQMPQTSRASGFWIVCSRKRSLMSTANGKKALGRARWRSRRRFAFDDCG